MKSQKIQKAKSQKKSLSYIGETKQWNSRIAFTHGQELMLLQQDEVLVQADQALVDHPEIQPNIIKCQHVTQKAKILNPKN